MILPRPNTLLSWMAARWLPALGSLLAVLGFACLLAGPMDIVAEVLRPPDAAAQNLPRERPDHSSVPDPAGWLEDVACQDGTVPRAGSCSTIAAADQPPVAALGNLFPQPLTLPERLHTEADCCGRGIDRGTRSESAHLSDLPRCPDPRHALAAMAASQHRGRGFRSRHTDGDEREALAVCVPALTQQPVLPRVAKHLAQPVSTPETSDVRESPLETVGAWR